MRERDEVVAAEGVSLLVVEDNDIDLMLITEALRRVDFAVKIAHVPDGEEAMAYLRREVPYSDRRSPDLILLDLNLPRKDGREVLDEIKGDQQLKHIPVIIFTTSNAEEDVMTSYASHANCYVIKPIGFERYAAAIAQIQAFWLATCALPRPRRRICVGAASTD